MRVLLDTNIVVDYLQKREPWWQDSQVIFRAAASKQICACITTKQIADIHYFSKKQFSGFPNVDSKARTVVGRLLSLLELLDTTASDCQNAFGIENGDYEDAMLAAAAVRESLDCIITRNPSHFKSAAIPVLSPAAFAALLD